MFGCLLRNNENFQKVHFVGRYKERDAEKYFVDLGIAIYSMRTFIFSYFF